MKRAAVLGFGKMGSWFARELLSAGMEVVVYEPSNSKLSGEHEIDFISDLSGLEAFQPELLLNASPLKHTTKAFCDALPYIEKTTLLADIASLKREVASFYSNQNNPFVSLHPMFGPTFAKLHDLKDQNAIILKESSPQGRDFFEHFFSRLQLRIHHLSFSEHDQAMAYSLSLPFFCTLLFASSIGKLDLPGSTFAKHLEIAKGLLKEDPELISEVMNSAESASVLTGLVDKACSIGELSLEPQKMISFINSIHSL